MNFIRKARFNRNIYIYAQLALCPLGLLGADNTEKSRLRSILTKAANTDKTTQKEGLFSRGAGFWTTPADENATGFFQKLTPRESQREDWYTTSPYIAEFWCCLSNAALIGVGAYCGSPELVFAGTASVVSHAIPKQWLLYVDKFGVLVAASKAVRTYPVLLNNPWLLAPIAGAAGLNALDAYCARKKGYTIPHVAWHCGAAAVAGLYLSHCPK
jgi:hypothetical protein